MVGLVISLALSLSGGCYQQADRNWAEEHRNWSRSVWAQYQVKPHHRDKHRHMLFCAPTVQGKQAIRAQWKAGKKRHGKKFYWRIRWDKLSAADKAWADSTASCESGHNPRTNTGNGFYGAFQFTASTAAAAGFQTLPHLTSWYEQAVRAVRWRNIAGSGQWPVCG